MTTQVPVGPFVTARDVKHGEFFLDANGLAWRADRTRVAELDSVPIAPAPLSRAEVVRVLASEWAAAGKRVTGVGVKADSWNCQGKRFVLRVVASRLGLSAAFERAIAKDGGP